MYDLMPAFVVFIVIGLPIICITLVTLAKILRGRGDGGRRPASSMNEADESELIQQIHRGLNRLEERIDSLETIVLSQERNRSSTRHE